MAYTNNDVALHLYDIATAYEIKHENRFRIISYENAADIIQSYHQDIYELWQQDPENLKKIPHIGQAIFKKINYLFKHHKPHPRTLQALKGIHPAVFTFTKINGIGPLNADKLTTNLKFSTDPVKALEQLIKYAQTGKIRDIPTFGEKSEIAILNSTLSFMGRTKRMPLKTAQKLADTIIDYLHQKFPQVKFIPLGSLRRQSESVGDIDIAAPYTDAQPIIDHFLAYPESVQTIAKGENKASIRLIHDVHVDLMIKPPHSFGALLQHFTGSRQHNVLLRKYALSMGYSLSEYGIKDIKTGQLHEFNSEEKFYNFLKLNFIPPPERTGDNELEAYKMV